MNELVSFKDLEPIGYIYGVPVFGDKTLTPGAILFVSFEKRTDLGWQKNLDIGGWDGHGEA